MTDSDVVILKALLDSREKFVSGNLMANELGISRVGVWARLEKLRKQGFIFEAIRHRGYRLLKEPAQLCLPLILGYLERMKSDLPVLFFEETDSTNIEAERQLAKGRTAPFVILAAKQNSGKGRLGRVWYSPKKENAYLSFVFRPNLPPSCMQPFTIWMGLNFCQVLNDTWGIPVGLKWPNDIVHEKRKAGGILTEARIDADSASQLVLGLGMNVNSKCDTWEPDLAEIATSLRAITGKELPINELTAGLIHCGITAYEKYISREFESELIPLWKRFDILKGLSVKAQQGKKVITGTVGGIDKNGSLKVRSENGKVALINSGEVTLGSARVLAGVG